MFAQRTWPDGILQSCRNVIRNNYLLEHDIYLFLPRPSIYWTSYNKRFLVCIGMLLVVTTTSQAQRSLKEWQGAVWVWDQTDANRENQSDAPRYLRRHFTSPKEIQKAELWITADNHYTAYVNGQKVGADGEWNTVENYDIRKYLQPGDNVLAIEARNAGGPAAIIARVQIQGKKGKAIRFGTDSQTKITQDAAKDWNTLSFDDKSWFNAVVVGKADIGPWNITGAVAKAGADYDFDQVDRSVTQRLSAEEEQKHFVFPKDFAVELLVADPVVINPVTLAMDDQGRLYVSESHTYRYGPGGSPVKPFTNPVVRLEKSRTAKPGNEHWWPKDSRTQSWGLLVKGIRYG